MDMGNRFDGAKWVPLIEQLRCVERSGIRAQGTPVEISVGGIYGLTYSYPAPGIIDVVRIEEFLSDDLCRVSMVPIESEATISYEKSPFTGATDVHPFVYLRHKVVDHASRKGFFRRKNGRWVMIPTGWVLCSIDLSEPCRDHPATDEQIAQFNAYESP